MRSGRLDRLLSVERSTETIDAYGVPVSSWQTVSTLRSELMESATTEADRDRGASTEARLKFRTRFVPGITLADRVTYAGASFNIVALEEIGRHRGLEITVERIGP